MHTYDRLLSSYAFLAAPPYFLGIGKSLGTPIPKSSGLAKATYVQLLKYVPSLPMGWGYPYPDLVCFPRPFLMKHKHFMVKKSSLHRLQIIYRLQISTKH
jgi:hypothetical protein